MKVSIIFFVASFVLHGVMSEEVHRNSSVFAIDGIVTTVKECLGQKEKMDCLKRKVINKFDEVLKNNDSVAINEIVSIKRDPEWVSQNNSQKGGRSYGFSVEEARGNTLNTMLVDRINDYLKSVVIQFSLSGSSEEGRKRKGGKGGSILMYGALGMASILSQLFMGKLAMISGTALLLAKISLLLALLTGLKKLSGGGEASSDHVVYAQSSGGGDHGGWQRSGAAHEMAYRGHYRQKKAEESMPMGYGFYQDGSNDMELS